MKQQQLNLEIMTIKNVTIGDKFSRGKNIICEVVDFYQIISTVTGECVGNQCIAKQINGFASNHFETPFASVVRNKIK